MKLWRQDKPHISRPIESASVETEGHSPGLGPLSRAHGHPVWHGLGLPCPACLLPGSTWVLVSRPGVWSPQALSKLFLGLPSGRPRGSTRARLHVPVLLPAIRGTDQVPGCPALDASLTTCHSVPTTTQAMWGARVSELRRGSHTQPSSSTHWLGRGGLSEPPSLGSWGSVAHGVSGAWEGRAVQGGGQRPDGCPC